jgi:nitrogen regulatory protein P-II 2
MKLIIAYIQPERLDAVKKSLQRHEVHRLSVTNALGCGSQMGYQESYRGSEREIQLLKKIRIEIAVNDDFEQLTIDAIVEAARTDKIGDGKIFVVPLTRCIRIRTGEEGPDAIG